jgi:predicted GNAT family N-acyltransferase
MISHNLSFLFFSLPSPLWDEVKALRFSVFVEEMNVPVELEIDEDDLLAIHLCVKAAQFYENFGFIQSGDIFDDAGIPYIGMILELSDVT